MRRVTLLLKNGKKAPVNIEVEDEQPDVVEFAGKLFYLFSDEGDVWIYNEALVVQGKIPEAP